MLPRWTLRTFALVFGRFTAGIVVDEVSALTASTQDGGQQLDRFYDERETDGEQADEEHALRQGQ